MTTIDVQPTTYFTAASALSTSATDLFAEIQAIYKALEMCGSMAGSYDEAKDWAQKYDTTAALAIELGTGLASTMDTYAKTLRTVGWNHQMADYNATTGTNKGPAPVRPTDPLPAVTMCQAPPPSAGGPGNGLSDIVHLAKKVGITIPDGDTDKLKTAGDDWLVVSRAPAVGGLADEIGRIINSLSLVQSPEVDTVIADLKNMQEGAQTLFELCGGLAADCYDHKIALGYLRSQLEKQLEELAAEILKEIGVGLAITIVTSMVTFGIGALIEVARVASIVERFAGPIADMVSGWKKARDFKKAVTGAEDAEKKAKDVEKLEQRVGQDERPPATEETPTQTAGADFTADDKWALNEYTGPDAESLNSCLRNGTTNARQDLLAKDLDSALAKLPDYKGPVTRRVSLDDADLAKFEKGKGITFKAYSSSTKDQAVDFGKGRNVEMQIFSKHGKDISSFARKPEEQEVLFPRNTTFRVIDKIPDKETGRTIIQMIEN
jgi:hypothetical protein